MSPADIEAARVKARRRMIGMAVLVGAGVIGFPWLFETQPRPMSADIEVVSAATTPAASTVTPPPAKAGPQLSPARETQASLPAAVVNASEAQETAPSSAAATGERQSQQPQGVAASAATAGQHDQEPKEVFENDPVPSASRAEASKPDEAQAQAKHDAKLKAQAEAKARLEARAKLEARLKAEAKARADAKAKTEALAKAKPPASASQAKPKPEAVVAKADPKHPAASKPAAKADANKPASKPEAKPAADTRYIVQVGAFGDAAAAHETRMKVERLGIKTYTHEIGAGSTRKIRVRVGPYGTKAEADKAMTALRKAGLGGALLTL